jgi:hypothetical protein
MEPKALTPFKDTPEVDKTAQALSELSLNKGMLMHAKVTIDVGAVTPLREVGLHLARRKSLQHAPMVSSPLALKSWTINDHQSSLDF